MKLLSTLSKRPMVGPLKGGQNSQTHPQELSLLLSLLCLISSRSPCSVSCLPCECISSTCPNSALSLSALTYRKLILALLDYSTLLPRQDLIFLCGFPAKDQPAPSFSLINLACDRLAAQGTTLCFIIFLIFLLSLIINGWGTHDRILLLSFLKKIVFSLETWSLWWWTNMKDGD